MKQAKQKIIIATRQSPLALWQTTLVKNRLLKQYPQLQVEILKKTTKGDQYKDVALQNIGGKELFVKDLQKSLLNKKADIAVHSLKDMSAKSHPNLTLGAVLKRDDPRDALISTRYSSLKNLPLGACVGTASPRRHCQLKSLRPDLQIKLIRGNINTRLQKIVDDEYDAIILSASGLQRLQLTKHITELLDPSLFIPAIGQAVIAVECRSNDTTIKSMISVLNDTPTKHCITAERAVNQRLEGDCFTPIAAYATLDADQITLSAMVGHIDGSCLLHHRKTATTAKAAALGLAVAESLLNQGAQKLLR